MGENDEKLTPTDPTHLEKIDLAHVSEWEDPINASFDQRASLEIARSVLKIFAGVYVICGILAAILIFKANLDAEDGVEIIKFLLTSALPLVTLAVGYYLGDRNSINT